MNQKTYFEIVKTSTLLDFIETGTLITEIYYDERFSYTCVWLPLHFGKELPTTIYTKEIND